MKSFDYVITDPVGMHARPAAVLAKLVKESMTDVIITANGKSVDASQLMLVMGMGIKMGTKINVTIEGAKEEEAEEKLKEFFESRL